MIDFEGKTAVFPKKSSILQEICPKIIDFWHISDISCRLLYIKNL